MRESQKSEKQRNVVWFIIAIITMLLVAWLCSCSDAADKISFKDVPTEYKIVDSIVYNQSSWFQGHQLKLYNTKWARLVSAYPPDPLKTINFIADANDLYIHISVADKSISFLRKSSGENFDNFYPQFQGFDPIQLKTVQTLKADSNTLAHLLKIFQQDADLLNSSKLLGEYTFMISG